MLEKIKTFIREMLSSGEGISNKRVLSWVIVITLICMIKAEKINESVVDSLFYICLMCIGGGSVEKFTEIFKNKKKS